MKRLVPLTILFFRSLATPTIAKVKVTLSAQHYKAGEEIHAKIENTGSSGVTFCVEFGQTSMNEGEVESTPSPFWVQRNNDGRWSTLIIGPDVGSLRGSIVLQEGESQDFHFRL